MKRASFITRVCLGFLDRVLDPIAARFFGAIAGVAQAVAASCRRKADVLAGGGPEPPSSELTFRDLAGWMQDREAREVVYEIPGYTFTITRVDERLHQLCLDQRVTCN